MAYQIEKKGVRDGLAPRRAPYWKTLTRGRQIGFRRLTEESIGSWLARAYDGSDYVQHPLGDFAAEQEKDRYGAAVKAAQEWFQHLDQGGAPKGGTVKSACEALVEKTREEKSEAAAVDLEGRFKRLVYDDPIARAELSRSRKDHFSDWAKRVRTAAKDASESRHPDAWKGSYNRNITALRRAMNLAHEDGKVATKSAWEMALKPIEDNPKERRREQYLDLEERRRLIESASEESQPFFRSLALLPLRPGELASLKVEHLFIGKSQLRVPSGKTAMRTVDLNSEALAHFKACAKDKLPSAWLVSRADGSQWKKESWRDELKAAVKKAKLPKATVAYSLRHSTITDLVAGGDVDLLTIANLAGTSVKMIQEHYWKQQPEQGRRALDKLSLA